MDSEKITVIANVAAALISLATKLTIAVVELIQNADMSQEDKDTLIARIKKAQSEVPAWE